MRPGLTSSKGVNCLSVLVIDSLRKFAVSGHLHVMVRACFKVVYGQGVLALRRFFSAGKSADALSN